MLPVTFEKLLSSMILSSILDSDFFKEDSVKVELFSGDLDCERSCRSSVSKSKCFKKS
jgi:hypothetical protein